MSGPLESITSAMITKALDVSLARHEVIANNIANSETAGYRPLTVNFDSIYEQMKGVLESGADFDAAKAAIGRTSLMTLGKVSAVNSTNTPADCPLAIS